jgi:hypothetical protein
VTSGRLEQWSQTLLTSARWLLRAASILNILRRRRNEQHAEPDKACHASATPTRCSKQMTACSTHRLLEQCHARDGVRQGEGNASSTRA